MNLNIKKKSIIYIIAPANMDTGGPKDLHQLAYFLKNNLKKKVFMYYYPTMLKNPIHKNYKFYKIPHTNKIIDSKDNILIIPEVNVSIEISKSFKKIQKAIWWLSLDFFFLHRFIERNNKYIRSIFKIPFKLISLFNKSTFFYFGNLSLYKYLKFCYMNLSFTNVLKIKDIAVNLAQANYQHEILKSKKIKSVFLSDYIRKEYFDSAKKISVSKKENIICYNPKKNSFFLKNFIKLNPQYKFIPLINYSLKDVIKILSKSKIYIDFGFHPGADHLPREAAILKNCILTNKEGSAFYYKDVPLHKDYKFDEIFNNNQKIKKQIDLIFENFPKQIKRFSNYRSIIKLQEKKFISEAKKIFN